MDFCQVFCGKFRPISTSLSPNTEWDDVMLAFKMIPGIILRGTTRNKTQNYAENLENEFKKYLEVKFAYSFNSGRSCLMAILYALGIKRGDEILIQAFTCNAVPNAIIWSEAKPVYVDIDETLNIDPNDLEEKIKMNEAESFSRKKAIIVQHTFGQPAAMDRILEIARSHNLYVIEDCAHSLGAKIHRTTQNGTQINTKNVGTVGDVAFFSFGRDKVISSVYGGMVVTNNPDLAKKVEEFQQKLSYPSRFWIFQQILHPILFNLLILPFYNFFGLGKFLLVFLQKINFLSKAVTSKEKKGEKPSYFPAKMPEALAALALNQFRKLERPSTRAKLGAGLVPHRPAPEKSRCGTGAGFNEHRRKIARFYEKNLPTNYEFYRITNNISRGIFWRYPILADNPKEIVKKAKKYAILFDDGWRGSPIVPVGTDLKAMGYQLGSCPKAEKIAKHILSLPTHINILEKDAQKIIIFLGRFVIRQDS